MGMTQVFCKFQALFPPPPCPIVPGTEAKDFPGQEEMECMTDQQRGRMTRFFLFCF